MREAFETVTRDCSNFESHMDENQCKENQGHEDIIDTKQCAHFKQWTNVEVAVLKYFDSTLFEDGRCSKEISVRIGMAKSAFMKRKKLVTMNVSLSLRKPLVWSILLYACESWTLKKADIKKIEAFEMWCWRRMMKVKWMDRITNEAAFEEVLEERSLMRSLYHRKIQDSRCFMYSTATVTIQVESSAVRDKKIKDNRIKVHKSDEVAEMGHCSSTIKSDVVRCVVIK